MNPAAALPRIDPVTHPGLHAAGVTLGVLRLDLLHPLWGGNKFFKLLPNLERARQQGYRTLLSFGGAHSNHLHALAALGHAHGFATVGIVRGEQPRVESPTLLDLRSWGMQLRFVSREEYRRRADPAWREAIARGSGPAWVIPEGGDNDEGFAGCRALGEAIQREHGADWDLLALACGSGTTLAGLVAGSELQVLGIAALRDAAGIAMRVATRLEREGIPVAGRYRVTQRFVGRGFARLDPVHRELAVSFAREHGIALDPVYTVKLMHGLLSLAATAAFARGTRILALHTGGLQGARWRVPSGTGDNDPAARHPAAARGSRETRRR